MPLAKDWADKVYVSCVFTENADRCKYWENIDHAWIGGSGYSLSLKLPPKVEVIKPKINLGFTTRGCIRRCPFCIVPQKEGNFHVVGDLLDLWDGCTTEITVLDNNILADVEHFKLVCRQAREKNLKVDFNQGLDHRLLTEEVIDELKSMRHNEYRFAFDSVKSFDTVGKAIDMLQRKGIRQAFWYVLVGFNTTFSEDMERLMYLRERGQTAFVMRYKKDRGNLLLGRWANQHNIFKGMTFDEFLKLPRNAAYRKKYGKEIDAYLK